MAEHAHQTGNILQAACKYVHETKSESLNQACIRLSEMRYFNKKLIHYVCNGILEDDHVHKKQYNKSMMLTLFITRAETRKYLER